MLKGITWYTVFIIVLIGFLTALSIILLNKFFGNTHQKATEFACRTKVYTYCEELLSGKDPEWDKIEPTSGCEDYGITEPPDEERCRELYET